MKKTLLIILVTAVFLITAVVFVRTLLFVPQQQATSQSVPELVAAENLVEHMSQAVAFRTISFASTEETPREPFEHFIAWLAETYPAVHEQLTVERVGEYSLLYHWQGSDPAQKPILLTGHYDVVPVPQASRSQWRHPPFGGVLGDGFVWGRGALDDKSAVITQLEAVASLLESGYLPRRDIYLAFGHDEEVGGKSRCRQHCHPPQRARRAVRLESG